MLKEIKYLIFLLFIIFFIFFTGKYYFSDDNKKNYFRTINSISKKIDQYSLNLPLLENDTTNIIEFVENNVSKNKKKYHFWKLLEND